MTTVEPSLGSTLVKLGSE